MMIRSDGSHVSSHYLLSIVASCKVSDPSLMFMKVCFIA